MGDGQLEEHCGGVKRSLPNIQSLVGRLPKAFVTLAFINFLVGASLGGWMAVRLSTWGLIGAVHGEINPFGWLTMLIYGMTYAVLAISAGIRPPKAWVGWLHLVSAELAVVVVVAGLLAGNTLLLRVGLILQFAAAALFLGNILSAVFARKQTHVNPDALYVQGEPHPLLALQRAYQYKATDRIGQRGTDMSLMLFLVGAGWMLARMLASRNVTPMQVPVGLFLVYYGWIGGTILAVALHLFPRFVVDGRIIAQTVTGIQIVWGIAVVFGAAGQGWSLLLASIGSRLLGLVFIVSGGVYLRLLFRHKPSYALRIGVASRFAWIASWMFSLALGFCLFFGVDPLSLVAIHLLFLGFATNLVYGIGYTLFPHILGRQSAGPKTEITQVAGAVLGSLLMVIGFADMQLAHPHVAFVLLAIGGTLAWTSATGFLLMWAIAKPE
ncbi:MAG: hypothetical protein K6T83_02465 [Alicyclobacillus sp.]|nr:hypothetical protein [Alicyclobacillus sp.]